MKELNFDTGLVRYKINKRGNLCFNPSDPNVYHRLKQLAPYISSLEREIEQRAEDAKNGEQAIDLLAEYDRKVKEKLGYVFGTENDFDEIFGSVNIMAIATNGEMVVTNFLNAICPIVEEGALTYAKAEARKAVQQANAERESR